MHVGSQGFHLGIALDNSVCLHKGLAGIVFSMGKHGIIVAAASALATAGHRDGDESMLDVGIGGMGPES